MKDKKLNEGNTIYLVIIGVLLIILIILGVILFTNNKENKGTNNVTNNNSTNGENSSDGSTSAGNSQNLINNTCTKKLSENEDYRVYYVEAFERDGEKAISSQTKVRLECVNEEAYKRTKENEDFGNNVKFDDENYIIIYDNGDPKDYTKDEDGNDITVLYEDLRQSYEEIEYTCN